jgi:hypothetical protein
MSTNPTVTFRNFNIFAIRFLIFLEDLKFGVTLIIIGHIIGYTFEVEKERR